MQTIAAVLYVADTGKEHTEKLFFTDQIDKTEMASVFYTGTTYDTICIMY